MGLFLRALTAFLILPGAVAFLVPWSLHPRGARTLGFASRTLWLYMGAVALGFHLRVVFGEEPWLAHTHGEEWLAYRARVPRWLLPP